MKSESKEKISLSVRQILLGLLDATITSLWIFDSYNYYRDAIQEYKKWRDLDKQKFYKDLYRLKKQGLIRLYKKEKASCLELTKRGEKKAINYLAKDLKIKSPKIWDKKWRIVIFDIPKKKKSARDVLREHLKRLGFLQLQKSVFVYPFDCSTEIKFLINIYLLRSYVQYIVADQIDTDINLIDLFLEKEILKDKQFKNK